MNRVVILVAIVTELRRLNSINALGRTSFGRCSFARVQLRWSLLIGARTWLLGVSPCPVRFPRLLPGRDKSENDGEPGDHCKGPDDLSCVSENTRGRGGCLPSPDPWASHVRIPRNRRVAREVWVLKRHDFQRGLKLMSVSTPRCERRQRAGETERRLGRGDFCCAGY